MDALGELRKKIDALDAEIVRALNQRADLVLKVKAAKEKDHIDIYSPGREREILDRVRQLAAGGSFPLTALERVYTAIVSATRSLIGELSVAFYGPEGSPAHEAAVKQFGEDIKCVPLAGFDDIAKKVSLGEFHYGVLPVETSSNGLITSTYQALMHSNVQVIAEIGLQRKLCLLSRWFGLSEVKRVISDVESFLHSMSWLRANLPMAEHIVVENSVVGAHRAQNEVGSALIASAGLAENFSLSVVASGIEDVDSRDSRYFVVGNQTEPKQTGNDKTSLVCSAEDRPGLLHDILLPFKKRKLSLTKIESKPDTASTYAFYIDVHGHKSDPQVGEAVAELQGVTSFLKVLGSYPLACKPGN